MDFLQNLLDQAQWPAASAFLLGLMTALSPCPLATNITAIGYIGRELQDRRRVGSVAKFVSLSDNWPILVIEKPDD